MLSSPGQGALFTFLHQHQWDLFSEERIRKGNEGGRPTLPHSHFQGGQEFKAPQLGRVISRGIHNVEFTTLVPLVLHFYFPLIWQFCFASHLCNILGQRLSSRFGLCTGDGNRRVDEVRVFVSEQMSPFSQCDIFTTLLALTFRSFQKHCCSQPGWGGEREFPASWQVAILVFLEIDSFWFVCGFKTTQADWFRAQDAWSKK